MAFKKTGDAITHPTTVNPFPQIGEKKDGLIWSGKEWVSMDEADLLDLTGEAELTASQLHAGLGVKPSDGS